VALSPSIPTSFVPKQPVSPRQRRYSGGNNVVLIISLIILGISLALAAGVFLYGQYLTSVQNTKASQLVAAQNSVSLDTLTEFVRLRDRLVASKTLLSQHVALSQFFTILESTTLQSVHFSSLQLNVAADRSAQFTLQGEAKSFNALAVESSTFAAQKNIKSAIFSGITVDSKTKVVSFSVNASLAPEVVVESTAPSAQTLLPASASATAPSFPASAAATVPSAATTTTGTTSSTTP
jgi:hypothetical protein